MLTRHSFKVSNTKDYEKFIPFIRTSTDFSVIQASSGKLSKKVELAVGVQGFSESTCLDPYLSVSMSPSSIFNYILSLLEYVSLVNCDPSACSVRATVDRDQSSSLFKTLETDWKVDPFIDSHHLLVGKGKKSTDAASIVNFSVLYDHLVLYYSFQPPYSYLLTLFSRIKSVRFEFHSIIHAKVADLVFEKTCAEMIYLFEQRANKLYGPPSRPSKTII